MKNKFYKFLSIVLSVLMLAVACVCPTVVSADTTALEDTNVVYIKTTHAGPIGQQVSVAAGETYTFTFSVSNEITPTVAVNDASQRYVSLLSNVTVTEVAKDTTTSDKYTTYTYDLAFADTFTETTAIVGIRVGGTKEGYLFNASLYNKSDAEKTEMFINSDFANGYLNNWVYKYMTFSPASATTGGLSSATFSAEGTALNSAGETYLEVMAFKDTPMYEEDSEPESDPEPKSGTYYVMSTGYDNTNTAGDGRSETSPAATVADVIATIIEDDFVAGDTATVYIMQDADGTTLYNSTTTTIGTKEYMKHNITSWCDETAVSGKVPEHDFTMVVKSPDGEQNYLAFESYVGVGAQMFMGGPTVFENVTLLATKKDYDATVVSNGYDVTVGEQTAFAFLNTGAITTWGAIQTKPLGVQLSQTSNGSYDDEINITLNNEYDYSKGSAKKTGLHIATYRYKGATNSGVTTYKDDVNVVIDNPNSVWSLVWGGSHSTYNAKFEKTLNVNIKSASKIVYGTGHTGTTGAISVANGLQIIYPSTTDFEDLSTMIADKGITNYWILENSTDDEDIISFAKDENDDVIAGTYNVKEGYDIVAVDDSSNEIYPVDGILTLETAGKYTIKDVTPTEPEPEPEPVTPKMLHITSNHTGPLGSQIASTAGETYTFKFGLSNNLDFDVVLHDRDTRSTKLAATTELKNSEDKGGYTYYEYEVTVPSTYTKDGVILGLTFKGTAPYDGYFFDASAYKTSDTEKTELFGNAAFADGTLNKWVWKYNNFGSNNLTSKTFTEDSKEVTVEVIDFDEDLMFDDSPKMLHINSNNAGPLGQQIAAKANETYTFKFEISNNAEFDVVVHDNDSRHTALAAQVEYVNSENKGRYTAYEYEVTMPSDLIKDYAIIGIKLKGTAPYDVYFMNASVYKTSDTANTEMLKNGDFFSGFLDNWVFKYENFTSGEKLGLKTSTFTQDDQSVTLEVMRFDEEKMLPNRQMFYIDDEKTTTQEGLALMAQTLQADVEYTVSFDYKFISGAWNQTLYFGVFGGVNEPGSANESGGTYRTISNHFYSIREENENLFTTISDDGRNLTCTFTLTEDQIGENIYFYAGFRFLPSPVMKTKLYLANMTLYESGDADKTNLLLSDEFETTVENWYSDYGGSSDSSKKIFRRGNVEYTAQYMPYNADYFETPTDIHYGDTNYDGDIDIIDLVTVDKIIADGAEYISNVDVNNSGTANNYDLSMIKKHMIGTKVIEWVENGHGLMEIESLSGGADLQAKELKNEIAASTDTLEKGSILNRVFYVAADGNDSNNGRSESAPITINKVNSLILYSGDLVLFKRGDTFRLSEAIVPVNGVGYGAYGEGAKPEILGSLKNYADESLWTTEDNSMWQVNLGTSDAEQVVFNGGEWVGFRKESLEEVNFNGDYYYDTTNKILYLYLNQINPAKYFDSIEIATTMRAFYYNSSKSNLENAKFENLSIKYFTFGFNLFFTEGVEIKNCEIGWIGGGYTSGGSRFGNAIQLWRYADNVNVSNNYIYQVFDAAITFQGSTDNDYTNLTFQNNLIEYCSMGFEFWGSDSSDRTETSSDPDATMKNIDFSNNILRFNGYGYGGLQRSSPDNQSFVLTWNNVYEEGQIENFTISNNIFDTAKSYFYYSPVSLVDIAISSNTYYQKAGSNHTIIKGEKSYGDDADAFATSIATVDSAPTKIEWVN